MNPDLTEDFLLKIAKDIEVSASSEALSGGGSAVEGDYGGSPGVGVGAGAGVDRAVVVSRERGKRLLRYLKQSENCSDFFKSRLCAQLRVISFVPVSRPVEVTLGGFVVYSAALGTFDEVISVSGGALGFTVMPVLDEDIAPPLIFFSSLAVATSPSIEVVLRHIRNLTVHCGDSLDRWNYSHSSVQETFAGIFEFLKDHWKGIVPSVQRALRESQIVPVGHFLVRPSRLFFRLQGEDLSPFMHEVPRCFGAQEGFLKELGVKEEPLAGDYVEVGS